MTGWTIERLDETSGGAAIPALAEILVDCVEGGASISFLAPLSLARAAPIETVTVCDSQAGTQESTRRAGEWAKKNVTGASIGAPQVTEGETFVQS